MLGSLRFPLRTAGFVGLTFGMYGLLEADTALSPRSERDEVLHDWMQRYGKALLRLYGCDVVARGAFVEQGRRYPGKDARGRGRVFVMNHRSGLDVAITLAFVESTIVSRADLAHWPVIGMAARRVGTLFVDRSSKKSGADVTHAMASAVARGRGVMIYPEGTTFAGDEVRPFRAGAFAVAERAEAEIIPVGLAYGEGGATFVDESFAAHMKRVSATRATPAAIAVGEPILPGRGVDRLRDEAHARVQALVHEARALLR
jgi:1-acyl-sn-glycerol-3-phosphate acyltransferase